MMGSAMATAARLRMYHGSGASMAEIGTGSVDLVITSPPYFSTETEGLLRRPRREQTEASLVSRQIRDFATGLQPVFHEIARVLRPGSALVLQTKDLVYGHQLIRLADAHADLAEAAGLVLVTRVQWLSMHGWEARRGGLERLRRVGAFRAKNTEEFLVFGHAHTGVVARSENVDLSSDELESCRQPIWRLPGPGGNKRHPFQSPSSVLRRFITLYSAPGDTVVDPFAGVGTALRIAQRLGRHATGYEIDAEYARLSIALSGPLT